MAATEVDSFNNTAAALHEVPSVTMVKIHSLSN